MQRREFITALGGAALWPLATLAQGTSKSYRIAYLALLPGERTTLAKLFLERLRDFGYDEGKNMLFEYRSAEGQAERVPELAAELVHDNPDVLVAGFGTVAAKAARAAYSLYRVSSRGNQDSRHCAGPTVRRFRSQKSEPVANCYRRSVLFQL
jgi:putative ABC transport system substrate-binding protein